jgi:hypothetical protein
VSGSIATKAEAIESAYRSAICKLAAEVRDSHVVPYCDRTGRSYETINGDWWFNDAKTGKRIDFWTLPKDLQAALQTPVWPSTSDLGCCMDCYYPKGKTTGIAP